MIFFFTYEEKLQLSLGWRYSQFVDITVVHTQRSSLDRDSLESQEEDGRACALYTEAMPSNHSTASQNLQPS